MNWFTFGKEQFLVINTKNGAYLSEWVTPLSADTGLLAFSENVLIKEIFTDLKFVLHYFHTGLCFITFLT